MVHHTASDVSCGNENKLQGLQNEKFLCGINVIFSKKILYHAIKFIYIKIYKRIFA
jgi:hypothetical protein